jgi:hypothetical protein
MTIWAEVVKGEKKVKDKCGEGKVDSVPPRGNPNYSPLYYHLIIIISYLVLDSCYGNNTMMEDNRSKTQCWQGWADKERKFGLEMQQPYSDLLVDGSKSIESRSYPLPEALLDTKIEILQSEKGQDGVSSVPNRVALHNSSDNSSSPLLKRIGWVTFSKCIQYTSCEEFEADREKHLVHPNSGYCWNYERPMFGWVVKSYYKREIVNGENVDTVAIRRMRSLFEIIAT